MLVSSSIPNFVNGISQQPYTLRLASQGETQENGLSTAAVGLRKRPPTQHLNKQAITSGDLFLHTINRDASERYVVVIQNGDLSVFDLAGNKKTVTFPNGKGYLGTIDGSPVSAQFAACSVADYTFIVNKNKVVAPGLASSPVKKNEALINVKLGNYGKTHNVKINDATVASYTTPDGSSPSHTASIATDFIAKQLYDGMVASGITAPTWNLALNGSIIYLEKTTGTFGLVTEDGFNSNAISVVKDRIAKFSELPGFPRVNNFIVEVAGDNTADSDDYWVHFEQNPGDNGGVWKECVAPGTRLGIDGTYMPWILVREANGTFTFKVATWATRKAGDVTTNPDSSFVGRKINDVFFYRNRLGFLSDENVIFSEAGEFFNLYRTTVLSLLDSDPIDVASTHTKVSILQHAIQFNKQLLLFSNQSQFVIDESSLLTPKSISIKLATEFPCNDRAKPVTAGRNVYFGVSKGGWSAVREYFVDTNNVQNDSTDITAHVPKYIPEGIYKLAASTNEDIIIAASETDRKSLYVYKYYYSGSEKLQSSWSRWVFGANDVILGMEVLESDLFLFIQRGSEMFFEKLSLAAATTVGVSEPFPVCLDRRVSVLRTSLGWDGVNTTIPVGAIGYTPEATENYAVVIATTNPTLKPGAVLEASVVGTNVVIKGDLRNNDLIFGRKYQFRYTLSPITVKAQGNQPRGRSFNEGRLQLRKISFQYADSGFFQVNVTPRGRQQYNYKFTGKVLGASAILGAVSLPTGEFSVPIMSVNTTTSIEIINDSPLPCSILSADWEGFYVTRSQSV
jgi:hypothetical protein